MLIGLWLLQVLCTLLLAGLARPVLVLPVVAGLVLKLTGLVASAAVLVVAALVFWALGRRRGGLSVFGTRAKLLLARYFSFRVLHEGGIEREGGDPRPVLFVLATPLPDGALPVAEVGCGRRECN
jgi:hypothetical protein